MEQPASLPSQRSSPPDERMRLSDPPRGRPRPPLRASGSNRAQGRRTHR